MKRRVPRRRILAAIGLTVWLTGCAPSRRTTVTGWQDGLPEAPEPFPDDGVDCAMVALLPKLALSPTGARVALVAQAPMEGFSGLTVWDTATGDVIDHSPLTGQHLQFLTDDDLLLTRGSAVIHHSVLTESNRWFGSGHTLLPAPCRGPVGITGLAILGQSLATVGRDGQFGVFRFDDATRTAWRQVTTDGFPSIVAAQGLIALGSHDSPVAVLDETGEHLADLPASAHRLAAASHGVVIDAGTEGAVQLVDLLTRHSTSLPAPTGEHHAAAATPSLLTTMSQPLRSDGVGPEITVTDLTTLTQASFPLPGDAGDAASLPGGEVLISDQHGVSAWDPATGAATRRFAVPA